MKSDLSYEKIVEEEKKEVFEIVTQSKQIRGTPVSEASCESS